MSINEPVEHSEGKEYGTSVVRTVSLPLVVTLISSFIFKQYNVDLSGWEPVAVGGLGYVSYAVVRFLEVFASDKWGYILGLPKAPTYR